ncbi:MAG TPA: A/G-specific adenine glycosylase, partial [Candidatus Thermoplasmatota archaeon]|nr:A/G-specific adenine glycosylase [Candidatus Thermoplasmatota archaeon]
AEFILQQTRMETGIRYFHSLLKKFPTIEALAAAREEYVLAAWSGLGYYRRARSLHATCRAIVAKHGGKVPSAPDALITLPGIGPYTAGAIASIAYDRPATSLDGNQIRVLSRLLGTRDPTRTRAQKTISSFALDLVKAGSPRIINQALMDLGSAVCLPETPRCGACPLARGCRSRGRIERRRAAAAPGPVEYWAADLWTRGEKTWLVGPRGGGVLGDLWMPPLRRLRAARPGPALRHAFSHKTWIVTPVRKRGEPSGNGRWVAPAQLVGLPHSALTKRLMAWRED